MNEKRDSGPPPSPEGDFPDLSLRPEISESTEPVLDHGESEWSDGEWQSSESRGRGWLAVAGLLLAVLVGASIWWFFLRGETASLPVPDVAPAPVADNPAVVEPEPVAEAAALPEEDLLGGDEDDDTMVRRVVGRLSSNPRVAAWLANDALIQRFTAVVANVAYDEDPLAHVRFLRPKEPFEVVDSHQETSVIAPSSYERFDLFAAAFASIDAEGASGAYRRLAVRIDQQWRELGHTESFEDALRQAAAKIRDVPIVDGEIEVRQKVLSWEYVDPRLEGLSPAQKQLLRTGPDNVARIRDKVAQLERALGL